MRRFRKKPQITRTDALNCTPIKNTEVLEAVLETGDLLLTYPVKTRPWAAGLVRRFGIGSPQTAMKKLQLDALGTAVWHLLDGRRTVRQVVQTFTRRHQLHPKEAEIAVAQFIRELGRRGLIGLQ
jgi:coenzyme PQQ synthesis protein D (PqqD)